MNSIVDGDRDAEDRISEKANVEPSEIVDPSTWRLEAERLAGVLTQKAASSARTGDSWQSHLTLLSESFAKLFLSRDANSTALGLDVETDLTEVHRAVVHTTSEIARMERMLQHRGALTESAKDYAVAANVPNYFFAYCISLQFLGTP